MDIFNIVMTVFISVLISILIILLITLVIRLLKTLNKIDKVVDDINKKSSKLDGVFNIIDSTTRTIETVNDKIVSSLMNGFTTFFKKKKGDKKDE